MMSTVHPRNLEHTCDVFDCLVGMKNRSVLHDDTTVRSGLYDGENDFFALET